MSKNKSMDGLYSDDRDQQIASTRALGYPFYVPGERHENLPAGGFAGRRKGMRGTPDQSVRFENMRFEHATGSDGQFGHADFGHGANGTQAGMGDFISDMQSRVQQAQTYAQEGQALYQTGQAMLATPSAPAPVSTSAVSPLTSSPIFTTKVAGIPVVVLVAAALGIYFVYKKMK